MARAATSDRLAANLKAETQLVADRGERWASLQAPCDIHNLCGAQTKSLVGVATTITKLIHLSLSLRMSGHMKRFRACLRSVVRMKLVLLPGKASAEAHEYRSFVLKLFLSGGSFAAKRRSMLWMWCSGAWRNTERVEHHVDLTGPVWARTPEYISRMITEAIVGAMASKPPSTFKRHRWTGCDLAVDEVGLLVAVHGLLRDAYIAFLVSCGSKLARASAFAPAAGGDASSGDHAPRPEGAMCDGPESSGDEDAEAALVGDMAPFPGEVDAPVDITDVDWQKLNREYRQGGFELLQSQPLANMLVLRTFLEPFRLLMAKYLKMSGDGWDDELQVADIKFQGAAPDSAPRLRAPLAAEGALEEEFFRLVRERMFGQRFWMHLPAEDRTVNLQNLCFVTLSRMGCSVSRMIVDHRSGFPLKLFLLLGDPSLAEDFLNIKPCLLDDFSRKFIATYKDKGPSHPDALMTLRTVAMVWRLDIADVESRHAALRRKLKASPQAKRLLLEGLSATWACRTLAKRQHRSGGKGTCAPQKKTKQTDKKRKHRKARRSAWHAYISHESQGRPANFRELGESYANLSKVEKKKFEQAARLASDPKGKAQKHRRAFVDPLKAARAKAARSRREAQWKRARAALTDDQRLDRLIDDVVASGASAERAIAAAGQEARFEQAMVRERNRETTACLRKFRDDQASMRTTDLAKFGLEGLANEDALVPMSVANAKAFDFAPDVAALAERALDFAIESHKSSNLGAALQLDWDRRTAVVNQTGLPTIQDPSNAERKAQKCRAVGECICTGDGRKLRIFVARLNNLVLKPHCKPRSQNRRLLVNGHLIVGMLPTPPPADRSVHFRDLEKPCLVTAGVATKWLHIGLHYLKPYAPSFQVLSCPRTARP